MLQVKVCLIFIHSRAKRILKTMQQSIRKVLYGQCKKKVKWILTFFPIDGQIYRTFGKEKVARSYKKVLNCIR